MNKKNKLKIGDKVSRVYGGTYSWNDTGIIKKITRKRLAPSFPIESVAEIKTLAGETEEIPLDNLEKA